MSLASYDAAMARLPYKRCDCGALYHSARCPYCGPRPVAKPESWFEEHIRESTRRVFGEPAEAKRS